METRGRSKVYLLGAYEAEILGANLPSNRQALGHFLHLHKVEKRTVRDSSRQAIEAISAFWTKVGIPVRASKHIIEKLEAVFLEWKGLQKHKTRTTLGHKTKENEFIDRLDDLFDIAHADAFTIMTNPADRAFLVSQRQKGRPGSIGAVDQMETCRKQRTHERKEAELMRKKRSHEELEMSNRKAALSTESSSHTEDTDVDEDYKENKTPKEYDEAAASAPKRANINVMSPGLTAALDRTKMSSRNATFVLSEVASSLGHDINTVNINRNSIQRAKISHRTSRWADLRSEFSASVPLTVHWDGKLMEDLTR